MKIFSTLACLFFLLCSANSLLAQPASDFRYPYPSAPLEPLTPQERRDLRNSTMRSDTMDILNYEINLDVTDFTGQTINGSCVVRMTPKMNGQQSVVLDLLGFGVDSVVGDNGPLAYNYDSLKLNVSFPTALDIGDTINVEVYYGGRPVLDPGGFGGFEFNSGYAYNLGIGLNSNPYNYGRGWFPCFDNFVERATYDFNIISSAGRKAYCSGDLLGQTAMGSDTIMRSYRMELPLPTYLAGIAVSNYVEIRGTHDGIEGPLTTLLLAQPQHEQAVRESFADLGPCIDALEFWFGPYIWGQVGFAVTVRGAMEHATLIAYPEFVAIGGNTFSHRRLMSHELAHHWFGNIATLSTPADMWFKEGNAEYAAHLFTEYLEGEEAFIKQVKDNHLLVMREAHIEDGDFLPLSGLPFENTYGVHTYQKGASMLHNMRGYLGDSLFRSGQQSALAFFEFDAVDAAMYRDHLTDATDVDMTSFFDDWIYSPGWAGHEIDSIQVEPVGGEFEVTVFFEQKLRNAPNFHTNVPLEVTFVDENWNTEVKRLMADGQLSSATTTLPFAPSLYYLNAEHTLNLSQWNAQMKVTEEGFVGFPYTDFGMTVNTLTPGDSAWVSVEHFWVGADEIQDPDLDVRISQNHYWRINGILPADFEANASLVWNGIASPNLDADLVGVTEDSIILVYRPDPSEEWIEYPHYTKFNPISVDQSGVFRLSQVLMGDYAFANGEFPLVSTDDGLLIDDMAIYPNPATDQLFISGTLEQPNELTFRLYDLQGRMMHASPAAPYQQHFQHHINLHRFESGVYLLEVSSPDGQLIKTRKIEIFN
ncbi:MAG: M1 family aminopeptidase [Bacteroidota bacterium]